MNQTRTTAGLIGITLTLGMNPSASSLAILHAVPLAQATPVMSPSAAPSTADKIKFRKKTIHTMKDELEQTVSAVQASSWGNASVIFGRALKKWYTFGGTIKRLSPETYEPVAVGFKTVNRSLNESNAPAKVVIADLQALIQKVKTAVTLSDAND